MGERTSGNNESRNVTLKIETFQTIRDEISWTAWKMV